MPRVLWADALSRAMENLFLDENGNLPRIADSVRLYATFQLRNERSARGKFTCSKCEKRWSSHKIVFHFKYGYDAARKCFEMSITEFGQRCQRCEGAFEVPEFDLEELGHQAEFLVKMIGIKFYGFEDDRPQWEEQVGVLEDVEYGIGSQAAPHLPRATRLR